MSEKHVIEIRLLLAESVVENLKTALRTNGFAHLSATQAVQQAIEVTTRDARAVKLDEPERRELESRTGAQVPIRSSKDILRAFERLIGGKDSVVIDIDPGIATVMRDVGAGMGLGFSEFAKQILEVAYLDGSMHTTDLKPLFFQQKEWDALTKALGQARIRSGGELLSIVMSKIPPEEKPCPSISTDAQPAA